MACGAIQFLAVSVSLGLVVGLACAGFVTLQLNGRPEMAAVVALVGVVG